MIKANEIRIGNWVSFFNPISGKIEYRQVTARFFSSLAGGRSESEMSPDEELNNYWQPIPLTPEILEKCGFREYEAGNGIYELWVDGKINQPHTIYLFEAEGGGYGQGFMWGNESHVVTIMHHLHQLQNLYYALTGTELEISLP